MDFNEKDWIERVKVAKDGDELRKLIHEIPLDTSSTINAARESSIAEIDSSDRRENPKFFGDYLMAFDQQDWEQRLSKARTQEEFTALVMELPEDSTPAGGPASSTTEPSKPSTPLILNTRKGKMQVG